MKKRRKKTSSTSEKEKVERSVSKWALKNKEIITLILAVVYPVINAVYNTLYQSKC